MVKLVRTEAHALTTTPELRDDVARTIVCYRRAVKLASTVAITHWPELAVLRSKERMSALEALFHATKDRPVVRYPVLDRVFGKMPSYLRRAALHAALGAVSSFLSNYDNWLDGEIGGEQRELGARPPRLGFSGVFPSLYGGNMILAGAGLKTVQVKLLRADGTWSFTAPLRVHGRLKRLAKHLDLSPALIQRGAQVLLSCPVEVRPPKYLKNAEIGRVCSVDVGINTAATAAIVDTTGTVIARKFLTCGRHNDRRDVLAEEAATKQWLSGGSRRGERFCSELYRRIAGLSLDAARRLAAELAEFAQRHGAKAVVIEDLKGWRPKGPSRKMRLRFHRFQHRMLVKHLTFKAQEFGLRVLEIHARGTSRWAYDGSGIVKRSKENAQLATFSTGKQYNADLNGALNIAARGLAMILGLENPRKKDTEIQAEKGRSPCSATRMPLVLADVWAHARASRGSSNLPAVPAGTFA